MGLRRFDLFPKLDDEFRVGTTYGGILSLLSLLAVIILSFVELKAYLNPPIRQGLIVDPTRPTGPDDITISADNQPHLSVFFNVSFPVTPCYLLHADVIDPVTQTALPLNKKNTVFERLAMDGRKIGELPQNFLDTGIPMINGSCGKVENKVCNTCMDVLTAYYEAGIEKMPKLGKIEQCQSVYDQINAMQNEGCRVTTSFKVVKVAAEFHVSPGIPWTIKGWHQHDMRPFNSTFNDLNLTHTIHRLRFTKTDRTLPLDGFEIVQEKPKPFRVVYTTDILEENFCASKYTLYNLKSQAPGLVVKYDVSPITAITYKDKEPFLHLLTRLLTVLGGVLGLFRFIDGFVFRTLRRQTSTEEKLQ